MEPLPKKREPAEEASDEKTTPVYDVERLHAEILRLNSEIADLKREIGEHYWRLFSADGQFEPSLGDVYNGIQSRLDDITGLETELQIIEDGMSQLIQPPVPLQFSRISCRSCGTVNDGNDSFCSSCGMKLKEDFTSEYKAEDYGICPLCGATLPEDTVFCYTCGARVKI
ncbi:MAG: zinc ribbon domain-containing protein [Synergistaceae bacterium]|jgi:predicted  nucleic acid-binding Zn-ribbon protein|nr:zinc ribbon domain-containing protein [Synergistaceae bacterium]